jgi:hypothetical protein
MTTISSALSPSQLNTDLPIWTPLVDKIQSTWQSFKQTVGSPVQKALFPFSHKLIHAHEKILETERQFFYDFWDPTKPLHPHLPSHEAIRNAFTYRKETSPIEVNGQALSLEYTVIEPLQREAKETQNFVYLGGIFAKNDTNIMSLYPFLASYLEEKKRNPSLSPIRFILMSQYDVKTQEKEVFRFKDIDEAGLATMTSLEAVQKKLGPIYQLVAYSLGSIVLAAGLKYDHGALPSRIYFDRGPSSLQKIGTTLGLTGFFLHQIAKFSGWDIDVGFEIQKHLGSRKEQKILVSSVKQDHRFSGEVSLSQSPYLLPLFGKDGFEAFCFDFTRQLYANESHHSLHNGLLDGYHLAQPASCLSNKKSMADLVISSFPHSLKKSEDLSNRNFFAKIDILNGMQQFHSLFKRFLKSFSSAD